MFGIAIYTFTNITSYAFYLSVLHIKYNKVRKTTSSPGNTHCLSSTWIQHEITNLHVMLHCVKGQSYIHNRAFILYTFTQTLNASPPGKEIPWMLWSKRHILFQHFIPLTFCALLHMLFIFRICACAQFICNKNYQAHIWLTAPTIVFYYISICCYFTSAKL